MSPRVACNVTVSHRLAGQRIRIRDSGVSTPRERVWAAAYWGERCGQCGRPFRMSEVACLTLVVLGSSLEDTLKHRVAPVCEDCTPPTQVERFGPPRPVPCAGCGRPLLWAYRRRTH